MNRLDLWPTPATLALALRDAPAGSTAAGQLARLVRLGLDRLPMPGSGATLARWQVLAAVAAHDLSLAKLYEGHTDALAVMQETDAADQHGSHIADRAQGMQSVERVQGIELPDDAGQPHAAKPLSGTAPEVWGMWAAEPPGQRVQVRQDAQGRVSLHGCKAWCSGAADVSHGLLTAWHADGRGPQLVRVAMRQPGISVSAAQWAAVGMADKAPAVRAASATPAAPLAMEFRIVMHLSCCGRPRDGA